MPQPLKKHWDIDPELQAKIAEARVRDDPAARIGEARRKMIIGTVIALVLLVVIGVIVVARLLHHSIGGLDGTLKSHDAQGKDAAAEVGD